MDDPTTIALNLTFFGTLGVALVMVFGLFLVFVTTLVIAGLGRLTAVTLMAVGRGLFRSGAANRPARAPKAAKPARAAKAATPATIPRAAKAATPGREAPAAKTAKPEPALSPDWAAAVSKADARAAARARASEAPAVKVSVRDLPSPTAPATEVAAVAPLVESATDRNGQPGSVPPAFKKVPMPAATSLLDTGSLVSLPGRLPLPGKPLPAQQNGQLQAPRAQERKAG